MNNLYVYSIGRHTINIRLVELLAHAINAGKEWDDKVWIIGNEHGAIAYGLGASESEALDYAVDEGMMTSELMDGDAIDEYMEWNYGEYPCSAGNEGKAIHTDYLWLCEVA